MNIIIDSTGKVVRASNNLRGLLTHMRYNTPREVELVRNVNGSGTLRVRFYNGDSCQAFFNSYPIMCNWVRTRKRLQGTLLVLCNCEYNYEPIVGRKNMCLCANSYPPPTCAKVQQCKP